MVFAGFNNSRRPSTIRNGDWDRDGVKNRNDCEPLNFRKQGPEHKSYTKDVDDENRRKRRALKFAGDKKGVADMRKEAKELYHEGIDAMDDSGDWYN